MFANLRRLHAVGAVAVVLAFIGLWALVARFEWVSPVFLPGPGATWSALVDGLRDGDLAALLGQTLMRMTYGWGVAAIVGIALGALIGTSPRLRAWVQPTLEFMRPLPASAIMPVAIALMGLSPAMVLFVIAFGAVWPVLLATIHGFATIEPRLVEVGRVMRISRPGFIWKVGLPHALPDMLGGLRLSLTVSLILAIVAEMLASQDGLGTAVMLAARSFRSADLFAGVVLLGLIGLVTNFLLGLAERRLLRWQHP